VNLRGTGKKAASAENQKKGKFHCGRENLRGCLQRKGGGFAKNGPHKESGGVIGEGGEEPKGKKEKRNNFSVPLNTKRKQGEKADSRRG